MKEVTKLVYETEDGKVFENKEDAIKYEEKFLNVKAYHIFYKPDLIEGRGLQEDGYILVHSRNNHKLFAEHFCYKEFGNKVGFVMGAYGSNAITTTWSISSCDLKSIDENKIITKIEEDFVEKIW